MKIKWVKSGTDKSFIEEINRNNPDGDMPIYNEACPQWLCVKIGNVDVFSDSVLSLFQCLAIGMNRV